MILGHVLDFPKLHRLEDVFSTCFLSIVQPRFISGKEARLFEQIVTSLEWSEIKVYLIKTPAQLSPNLEALEKQFTR